MQRPENSNLFCCFLAWRLADYISQRTYKVPYATSKNSHSFLGCFIEWPLPDTSV
jgi:hypothetical protein